MSFNADDPLAGILSDGSDDSFFDDNILSKKKPVKKKDTAPSVSDKKNTLFDLDELSKTKTNDNTFLSSKGYDVNVEPRKILSKIENKSLSPAPMKRTFSKDNINITKEPKSNTMTTEYIQSPMKANISKKVEKIDILGDLLEDKKSTKPLEKGKSSQSLLDDILGGPILKTPVSRPAISTKNQDINFDSIIEKSESKQTLTSSMASKQILSKLEHKPETSPASQPKKKSDDWLGIFQEKEESIEEEKDVPSWLTSGKTKRAEKEIKTVSEPERVDETNIEQKEKPSDKEDIQVNSVNFEVRDDVTAGMAMCLQQQEAQLMVALQLKAQDEKLAAMQSRQKETHKVQRVVASAHNEQLDAMLRRQAEHRRQMQAIIASHQDRITQRIKALLVDGEETEGGTPDGEVDMPEIKGSPYSRENKQLLQLVESLQRNHDKEIDLMETSYRRQLDFLEVSYNQAEERMKEESEKLVKFYTEKISWLDEHHQLYKRMTEDNLNSIVDRHKVESDVLRQQHLDNIKVLQEHHAALMENIKNAVKQEQVLIKDSTEFSSDLQDLVVDVKENNKKCQQLYGRVEILMQETGRDSEKSLQIREKQITDMIDQLKQERENLEKEKSENKDIVKMLEGRLRQMTTVMEEETASLRQKKMEFEFEKATFGKQTEFAKNVLKKQDEDVKVLKEELQKEYQEKISQIEEEKNKILKESTFTAKEKASIQSLKLEIEKTKAELDAQLQEVIEERSKLNAEKQTIFIEKQRITAKSRDLDLLATSAIEKQSQADKRLSEANFIQQKYEDRIRRIQDHVVSLNMREKQIAKEKVALSRERLSLHNERKQLDETQCSLCRTNYVPEPMLRVVHRDYGISRDFTNNLDFAVTNGDSGNINRFGNLSRDYGMDLETEISNLREPRLEGRQEIDNAENVQESKQFKSYMDPKLMMLRLDVQKVINNLAHSMKSDEVTCKKSDDEHQNG